MEPLLKQLRELPNRFNALPTSVKRWVIGGGIALLVIAAVSATLVGKGEGYQYVFTNLSTEDSAEATAALKAARIPFRVEAGGAALAVPANQVYDARLLLATAGLPRGSGVGFELFDKGDLGVSEFTQKVNLRRATEGELARTIGRLSEVRSARVHLTLPEKGIFRHDEQKGSAAVVLNLHNGRTIGKQQLLGIKHLVASAVPGLNPDQVTVVDGNGTVLGSEPPPHEVAAAWQQKLERDLEDRVVTLLEPVVGAGSVFARVTASVDASEIDTQQEAYDPETIALRSERKVSQSQSQSQETVKAAGIAGAAANQPLSGANTGNTGTRGSSSMDDEIKNYEVTKTVTKQVVKTPRLKRLSIAVVVDGIDGKPRSQEEVVRLGELAKKAAGFDETRGDQFEISSSAFPREAPKAEAPTLISKVKPLHWGIAGGVLFVLLAIAAILIARRPRSAPMAAEIIKPGAKVGDLMAGKIAELEGAAAAATAALPEGEKAPAGAEVPEGALQTTEPEPAVDPVIALRTRAQELAAKDPVRAARLLRSWMTADLEEAQQQANQQAEARP